MLTAKGPSGMEPTPALWVGEVPQVREVVKVCPALADTMFCPWGHEVLQATRSVSSSAASHRSSLQPESFCCELQIHGLKLLLLTVAC